MSQTEIYGYYGYCHHYYYFSVYTVKNLSQRIVIVNNNKK